MYWHCDMVPTVRVVGFDGDFAGSVKNAPAARMHRLAQELKWHPQMNAKATVAMRITRVETHGASEE